MTIIYFLFFSRFDDVGLKSSNRLKALIARVKYFGEWVGLGDNRHLSYDAQVSGNEDNPLG